MALKNAKMFNKEEIEDAIFEGKTMGRAAQLLSVDKRTFKKEADKYGLYDPGSRTSFKYDLDDILSGKYPQYPTSKILPRLVKAGLCEYKCSCCGINEYMGKRIGLELDHIDGDNSNHSLNNLRALCPNCHSQTDTYRSKKLKFLRLNNGTLA